MARIGYKTTVTANGKTTEHANIKEACKVHGLKYNTVAVHFNRNKETKTYTSRNGITLERI